MRRFDRLLSEVLDIEGPLPDEDEFSTPLHFGAIVDLPESWTRDKPTRTEFGRDIWPLPQHVEDEIVTGIENKIEEHIFAFTVYGRAERPTSRRPGRELWEVSWTALGTWELLKRTRDKTFDLGGDVLVHITEIERI